MSNIKALIVTNLSNEGVDLITNHNYEFSYSKTGSIKYTGIYTPKYFKKEVLNSYKSIEIGNARLLLFTEDFEINRNKCFKSILNFFILNTEIKITQAEEHLVLLKTQLSNF
jgi:hypothetical protein